MTDEQARALAKRAQGGDAGARDELVEAHMPLCGLIAREWTKTFPGVARDYAGSYADCRQECAMAMLLAIGDYRADGRVPFRSFMRVRMRGRLWNLVKRQARRYHGHVRAQGMGALEPAEELGVEDAYIHKQRTAWGMRLLDSYRGNGVITERQYAFLMERARGATVVEIARKWSLSTVTVFKDLKRARRAMVGEDA